MFLLAGMTKICLKEIDRLGAADKRTSPAAERHFVQLLRRGGESKLLLFFLTYCCTLDPERIRTLQNLRGGEIPKTHADYVP